ncbi:MAG TPA: hypothetical protein VIG88_11085, partial [Lysobacter sp.]
MNPAPCPACGCGASSSAHAIAGHLLHCDVDAALDAGLLHAEPCAACAPACAAQLAEARATRLA